MSKEGIYVVPYSRLTLFGLGDKEACLSRGAQIIARVLRLLEARDDFRFLIENVVHLSAFLKAHPEAVRRVRGVVSEGRLELGAGWTQMDHRLSAGEDLVRNLLYGKSFVRDTLGADPTVVHLGDGRGTTSQYVQVAARCGVELVVFAGNGWNQDVLFRWPGPDGSRVICWDALGGGHLLWEAIRGTPQSRRAANDVIAGQRETHDGGLALHWGGLMVQPNEETLAQLEAWAEEQDVELKLETLSGILPQSRTMARHREVRRRNSPDGPHPEPVFPETAPLNDPAVHGLLRAEQMSAIAETFLESEYPGTVLKAAWLRQLEATSYRFDGAAAKEGLERRRSDQQGVIDAAEGISRNAEGMIAERVIPQRRSGRQDAHCGVQSVILAAHRPGGSARHVLR